MLASRNGSGWPALAACIHEEPGSSRIATAGAARTTVSRAVSNQASSSKGAKHVTKKPAARD